MVTNDSGRYCHRGTAPTTHSKSTVLNRVAWQKNRTPCCVIAKLLEPLSPLWRSPLWRFTLLSLQKANLSETHKAPDRGQSIHRSLCPLREIQNLFRFHFSYYWENFLHRYSFSSHSKDSTNKRPLPCSCNPKASNPRSYHSQNFLEFPRTT